MSPEQSQPCDICIGLKKLLPAIYGNLVPNPTSRFCSRCNKWICDRCFFSLGRLGVAGHDLYQRLVA